MNRLLHIAQAQFEQVGEARSGAEVCVEVLLRYHGLACETVRIPGDTMLDVFNALSDGGLSVCGLEGSIASLRALGVPALLHIASENGEGRFVVCFGYESGKFVIGDPVRGIRRLAAPELARRWTSRALLSVDGLYDGGAARYRCFGVRMVRCGHDRTFAVGHRSGRARILSASESEGLLATNVFRTLDGHEASICALLGRRGSGSTAAVTLTTLQEWVDEGLLVSEVELRTSVVRSTMAAVNGAHGGTRVTSVGIPTCGRHEALGRALRSYASNTRAHGRHTRFCVAGTVSPAAQSELDAQLDALRAELAVDVVHLGDAWKRCLVDEMAEEIDTDPALVRFALSGDERCRSNYGANRNALLLATTGELSVQVDDDTLVPGCVVPGVKSGVAVSSAFDPNEYWFDEPPWVSNDAVDVDFLTLHEDLLGRKPSTILSEYEAPDIIIDQLELSLLEAIQHADARIGMTFVGHDGDVGTAANGWRLFLEGDSLARLIRPGYAGRIRQRESGRTVTRRTISDGLFCAAMNLGLDNRGLLPPFMPVGRNEDGVFSAVLGACFPYCLRGFREGYVIRHRPVERRSSFASPVRFDGLKANDVIALLIQAKRVSRPPGLQEGLRWLGRDLRAIGGLDQTAFDRLVRSFVQESIGLGMVDVERSLATHGVLSPELALDLGAYLESMEAFVVREDCAVPIDLDGAPSERRALFRWLVRTYGELLIHWPDIVDCARFSQIHRTGYA